MASLAHAFPVPLGGDVEPAPTAAEVAAAESSIQSGRDLSLDGDADLTVANGDLVLTTGLESIRQDVVSALLLHKGEWFLDVNTGIPYFQSVYVKAPNLALLQNVFRDAILQCVGIVSVVSLDLNFNKSTRRLTVTWRAQATLGPLGGTV